MVVGGLGFALSERCKAGSSMVKGGTRKGCWCRWRMPSCWDSRHLDPVQKQHLPPHHAGLPCTQNRDPVVLPQTMQIRHGGYASNRTSGATADQQAAAAAAAAVDLNQAQLARAENACGSHAWCSQAS